MLQFFTKKLLQAFLEAKSLMTISRSMLSKISFSIQHMANPFNLSCNMVDLKQFFSSFNLEKARKSTVPRKSRRESRNQGLKGHLIAAAGGRPAGRPCESLRDRESSRRRRTSPRGDQDQTQMPRCDSIDRIDRCSMPGVVPFPLP